MGKFAENLNLGKRVLPSWLLIKNSTPRQKTKQINKQNKNKKSNKNKTK